MTTSNNEFDLQPLPVALDKLRLLAKLGVPYVYIVWECPTCHDTVECRVPINNDPSHKMIGLFKAYKHDACGTVIQTADPTIKWDARGFSSPQHATEMP